MRWVDPHSDDFRFGLWSRVTDCLTRLKGKHPKHCDWDVDEIRDGLFTEEYGLIDFGDLFAILEEVDGFAAVRIACAYDGHTISLGDHAAKLNEAITRAGYRGLIFSTARAGWGRVAEKAGFREYSRTVEYIYVGDDDEKTKGTAD